MGKKKHPFIDKKTAQKFKVVHRSQRDPLQPDPESSQHVLVPAGTEGLPDGNNTSEASHEEKVKYGIYYDDDYDYLQHLRPRGEGMLIMAEDFGPAKPKPKPKRKDEIFGISLPTEVLPSKYEEDIGMLNKGVLPRGPQPDWDPDIVACLDDDIDLDDPDNLLEDNFITLANEEGGGFFEEGDYNEGGHVFHEGFDYVPADMPDLEELPMGGPMAGPPPETSAKKPEELAEDSEDESDVSSSGNFQLDQDLSDFEDDDSADETKSRFTDYSMTSSVIRRTQGLKTLDDRFERIMEEYDEEEIGARDHEEITIGNLNINDDLMTDIVEQFIIDHTKIPFADAVDEEEAVIGGGSSGESEVDDEELFKEFEKKEKPDWDCESIISTYSNIYNHPKIIDEPKRIKLHDRTGIPLGVLKDNKKASKDEEKCESEDENLKEQIVLNNIRLKTETPEEKKARKQEVKKFRAERRKEKKDTKTFFNDEHRKQERISMNKSSLIAIP